MTITELPPFLDAALPVPAEETGWLADLRQAGLDIYKKKGLPTRKVEAWRYTNLGGLAKTEFSPAALDVTVAADKLPCAAALSLDALTLVFVNGRFDPELSDLGSPPKGLRVESLSKVLQTEPEVIEPLLGKLAGLDDLPLAALNTGLLTDGLFVKLAKDTQLDKALHVVSVASGGGAPAAFHPRNLIVLEAGAQATIVESHVGLADFATFENSVTEVTLGAGAELRHYRLLNGPDNAYNVGVTLADVAENARYESFTLAIGGALSRNEVRVTLSGEGSHASVNGSYAVRAGQHVDNTILVDHAVPRATSGQLFKGVLDETGKAVFQGKVLVRKDAQGTDGQQLHKALLLSRGAEVDTKPELEIYADDVKCSHGATVGEMDADQLFYLMARGIDEETALALLVEAFVEDVVQEISDEVAREAFIHKVRDWQKSRDAAVWSE
jgi:Fe-S cluster assembly protein SufD